MSPPRARRRCKRPSRFGECHRTRGHRSVHATFIGPPRLWFAWGHRQVRIGYGHFDHGRFKALASNRPGGEA